MLYEISEKAIQLENQGKSIIKFNLGDPDLPTPPEIIEAAYEAMKQGKTKYSQRFFGQCCINYRFKMGNFLFNVYSIKER